MEKAIAGDGRYLLYYADQLRGRAADGQYNTSFFAFPAISCADSQDDGIARAFSDWASDQKKAPIFGKYFGPNIACVQWPVQGQAPIDITAKGAAPIVVIGATGDSATPYQYAAWMAAQLDSACWSPTTGTGTPPVRRQEHLRRQRGGRVLRQGHGATRRAVLYEVVLAAMT